MKNFDLKTFVTVLMTVGLLVFTWTGKIDSGLFVSTCGAVFAYYFNKDKSREPIVITETVEVEKETKNEIGFKTNPIKEE